MATRYHIPEAILGAGGLGIFAWLFPVVTSINNTITSEAFQSTVNIQSMEFYILTMCSALCILATAAFFMIGFYFSWVVLEDGLVSLWRKYHG